MNALERMQAVLSHQVPDRIPAYPILSGVSRNLVGATYEEWSTDADVCARGLIKAAEDYDLDCVVSLVDLSIEAEAWGQPLIFPENEAAHPDYNNCIVQDIEDYEKIQVVDIKDAKRMNFHLEVCRKLVAEMKGKMPVVAFVFGSLGVLSMLRGQQDLFMDLYDDPEAVQQAAENVTTTLEQYVEAVLDTGVDAVMFDTLFASGSIMSKSMWDEIEGPLAERLANVCHRRGVPVMIHNCGERVYFDVQIDRMQPAAISFLYPPDDCKSFAEGKEKYGDKITLIGCVPPPLVVTGSDEEWDAACRASIDEMGANGGFVLATGCEYPANASLDRAKRMVDIAKTYGKYE